MSDTTYNGYSNYETWCVCLWLDNDQGTQEYWRDRAKEYLKESTYGPSHHCWTPWQVALFGMEDEIKTEITDEACDNKAPGMFGDLLTSALQTVDWYEVAETRFDDDWEGVEK